MGKYKVGDKVRVKSKEWWDAQPKNEFGNVCCGDQVFIKSMTNMCGKCVTIKEKFESGNYLIKEYTNVVWTDEMFEDIPTNEQSTLYTAIANAINKVVLEHNQSVIVEEIEGGIIIKPIEEKEEDLPIDTPCMVSFNEYDEWRLRYYAGNHKCFDSGKIHSNSFSETKWSYIIPFDKFNPNNIEESLKHNIVK